MDTFLIISNSISASRVVLALMLSSLYANAPMKELGARSIQRARSAMGLIH